MAKKGNQGTTLPANPNRQVHIPADIRALGSAGNEIANRIAQYIRSTHRKKEGDH